MKLCNHEGCKNNQFGGGYCKYHQHDRGIKAKNKLLRNSYTLKKGKIKKVSAKDRTRRKIKLKLIEKDRQLWNTIWEEREHLDFETGEPIYGEPLTLYFHHVLPKHDGPGGYPQFRYCKWNIVIISWQTHTNAENNIDLVPKIKAYRDKLLKTKIK